MKQKTKTPADLMDDSIKGFPNQLDNEDNVLGLFRTDGLPAAPIKKPVNLALANIRAAKRLMREVLSDILNSENENGDSRAEVVLDKLVEKAELGDVKATELIVKILGETADTKIDVNLPEIKILVSSDKSGIRDKEIPDDLLNNI